LPLAAGTRLGPYEILAPLGAGAMGEVYRARDPRLDRDVALKVLPDELAEPERLQRFEREARAAGTLNHPHVLTIYDVGSHEGRPYIVAELLEGRTLRDRLGGAALPAREAVACAVQIARGLAAAHRKGVVHRDLKPENVFVTEDGVAKILDFGLAKVTSPERPVLESATTETKGLETRVGTVMGTLGYMSPEQLRGEVADHRTDIFSLGVMLYEMVAGRRPFLGQSSADTISAILTQAPPTLTEGTGDVPPALDGIVRRCLAKGRDDRFSEAKDLALALEALSERTPPRPPTTAHTKPRRLLAGGSCLVALLTATGLWLWPREPVPRKGPERVRSLAVLPLENLSGDPELEYFADGMTEALIADLSQIEALRVVSRTSAMRYKGSPKSAPEIAAELGVDALVEGSVLTSEARVRVTAQLIDGEADEHLWAESYERDLKEVLSLQSEVARRIAREVDASLTPAEEKRLSHRHEVDPEAYDAYLRGDVRLFSDTRESADAVVASLKRAIDLDPEFAPAYARLADFYGFMTLRGFMDQAQAYLEARRLAGRAVELDPGLAAAHSTLARILFQYEWDWDGAEREFEQALHLNPNDAETLTTHGVYLVVVRARCDEGVESLQSAADRDPFNYGLWFNLGVCTLHCRRFDDSIRALNRALGFRPGITMAHQVLAWDYSMKGEHEKALRLAEQIAASLNGAYDASALMTGSVVNARAGRQTEARQYLERLRSPPPGERVDPIWAAFACAALGDEDGALDGLEKGYRLRSSNMVFLRVAPAWDSLRDHPRFRALLERMNFPP
jgi:serine/threonine protein kinase/Tfp pilus assembly protein PilF